MQSTRLGAQKRKGVMPKLPLQSIALAFALVGSVGFGLAQDKVGSSKAEALQKQDTVPPVVGKNLSEQAGTTEPSSKVKGSASADVFVNGVLAVPGAPTEVHTTPAKFSARTAADDQLPIAAYRLRHLTDDQRRDIYQQLSRERGGGFRPAAANDDDQHAVVGALVPANIALNGLSPIPVAVAARFSELRDVAFTRSTGKLLLIDPINRLVIGVLSAQ